MVVSSRDVADFTLYIRDDQNIILYQKDYTYNVRKAEIPVNKLQMTGNQSHGSHHHHNAGGLSNREICIIARQSNGEIGHWYQTQCQQLPLLKMKKFSFLATLFSSSSSNNPSNSNARAENGSQSSSGSSNSGSASMKIIGKSKDIILVSHLLLLLLLSWSRRYWSL